MMKIEIQGIIYIFFEMDFSVRQSRIGQRDIYICIRYVYKEDILFYKLNFLVFIVRNNSKNMDENEDGNLIRYNSLIGRLMVGGWLFRRSSRKRRGFEDGLEVFL